MQVSHMHKKSRNQNIDWMLLLGSRAVVVYMQMCQCVVKRWVCAHTPMLSYNPHASSMFYKGRTKTGGKQKLTISKQNENQVLHQNRDISSVILATFGVLYGQIHKYNMSNSIFFWRKMTIFYINIICGSINILSYKLEAKLVPYNFDLYFIQEFHDCSFLMLTSILNLHQLYIILFPSYVILYRIFIMLLRMLYW